MTHAFVSIARTPAAAHITPYMHPHETSLGTFRSSRKRAFVVMGDPSIEFKKKSQEGRRDLSETPSDGWSRPGQERGVDGGKQGRRNKKKESGATEQLQQKGRVGDLFHFS